MEAVLSEFVLETLPNDRYPQKKSYDLSWILSDILGNVLKMTL